MRLGKALLLVVLIAALAIPPPAVADDPCESNIEVRTYIRPVTGPSTTDCDNALIQPGSTTIAVSWVQYEPRICFFADVGTLVFAGVSYVLHIGSCESDSDGRRAYHMVPVDIDGPGSGWPRSTVDGGDAVITICLPNKPCQSVVYTTVLSPAT